MRSLSTGMSDRGSCASISSDYKISHHGGRLSRTSDMRLVMLSSVFVLFLLAGIWSAFQVAGMKEEINNLKAVSDSIELQHADLEAKRAKLLSKESLEALGRKMGLHAADKKQVVVLN